ncbi:FhaA domain-containing protein, partial [Agrococcus terreus]
QQWGRALAEELCDEAIRHASVQGYSLSGPVRVTFVADEAVDRGDMEITSSSEAAEDLEPGQPITYTPNKQVSSPVVQPPAEMTDPGAQVDRTSWRPVVEIEGTRYAINSAAAIIGRSADADITVGDPGMSRRHLEIRVAGDRVSAVDLGSTNGFYVNGQKAGNSVDLHHGDIIT